MNLYGERMIVFTEQKVMQKRKQQETNVHRYFQLPPDAAEG